MLQAALHKKITVPTLEDTLTSSVVGLMQFLPDDIFWPLLAESCGVSVHLPASIGKITGVNFWPRFDARNTCNSTYVEPDVWIETDIYDIIIEAKRYDGGGQCLEQWEKEIIALNNERNNDKEIIFISLGGNTSHTNDSCVVDGKEVCIYKASWFNLLHAVNNRRKRLSENGSGCLSRLLGAIADAFFMHGYYDIEWLESLECINLPSYRTSLFTEILNFDNQDFFAALYTPAAGFSENSIMVWNEKKN